MRITPPADYLLRRDVCSYGYFLLAPNYWDVKAETLSRPLRTSGGVYQTVISQPGGAGEPLAVKIAPTPAAADKKEIRAQLTRMLRLDESAEHIAEFHALDRRFKKSGRGRLFRSPTLFEDVIKTVTSCNVTWPSTVQMNHRLCDVLGDRAEKDWPAAFPVIDRVARAKPATLRARCRVGYRDARIVELAKLFRASPAKGGLDQARLEDATTPDDEVYDTLLDLPGIGPYAAANIMQLLGRYARLPLDTESVRHGRTVLGMEGTSAEITRRLHGHYEPFGEHRFRSYWFELWDYYEGRHGRAWTWDRDSTGRLFTAAQLSKPAST